MSLSYRMSPMKLSTLVKRLQRIYGKDKIDSQLVLDMLSVIGVEPYYSQTVKEYYIDSFDGYEIMCSIADYPLGAPVDKIFDIGITGSEN